MSETLAPKSAVAVKFSRPGLLFAALGLMGLALPFVSFRANRIVAGEGFRLTDAVGPGWVLTGVLTAMLLAGVSSALPRTVRLALGAAGALIALGAATRHLTPDGNTMARVSMGAGFWLILMAFVLMATDALSRLRLGLAARWAMLAATVAILGGIIASGWLDGTSVMREYAARADIFGREAVRHLQLAFGSLGLALLLGLPLGLLLYARERLRGPVLSALNMMQTIPSLALFGIMIPIFGWIAANIPGAASAGVAGIGPFPALVALFLYALLPVVSNTVVGLASVSPDTRDAARGIGMTDRQVMFGVLLPLALPMILAAVRIVLVQNIGLAVIAGLIGGGGFGSFVFQGLNQTAMDLVLLGALPTIALALVAGIALDLIVEGLRHERKTA